MGRVHSHGLSRSQSLKWLPFPWVDPYCNSSVDSLLEAILKIDEVADVEPLVFEVTHLRGPRQIVRVVRAI